MKSQLNYKSTSKPKIKFNQGEDYKFVQETVSSNKLHTVCEEARCPNIFECWNRGPATIMILGDICTRACGFCSVSTGKPKIGAHGKPVVFLHPKSCNGTLIELEEV